MVQVSNLIQQSMIQWAEEQLSARRDNYDRARNYYGGEHEVKLTDRLKLIMQAQGLQFADNFCDVVVDAVAERLNVLGFAGPDEKLNDWLWQIWQFNRMDGGQIVTHTESVMLGDCYVLVDWDNDEQRPRITPQMPEMIIPHYNAETGKMDWLSKKWTVIEVGEDPITRMNLYYPDRVEKYIVKGGAWVQFQDPTDLAWPEQWVDQSGDPLGVSLFHFRNKHLSGNYGESEIQDIIPMQDLLNKSLVDLVQVMDTMAWGRPWTLNVNHDVSKYEISAGSVTKLFAEEDADAEIGEWAAADPSGLLKVIEMLVEHIAITSRTPGNMFRLSGDFPSGEALKVSESGLVKKVQRRQRSFGNAWEDAMLMCVKLEETFGSLKFADPQIETVWDDPESRNEESHLRTLATKGELGVPQKQLWREMGYSEADIDQMERDVMDETVRDTNIGSAILRNFETQGA